MTDQKWVMIPVEPTPEMVEAAEDEYMPFGDMEMAIRMAVLAAPQPAEQQPAPDVAGLVEALNDLLAIISESTGVVGYHLNGDVAEWDEFGEVDAAKAALAHQKRETSHDE